MIPEALLEQAKAGKLDPAHNYVFTFDEAGVLVGVRPTVGTTRTEIAFRDPEKYAEASQRLQEACQAEEVPKGPKLGRKARRAIHASANAHIRRQTRKMKRKLNQARREARMYASKADRTWLMLMDTRTTEQWEVADG